MLRDQLGLDVPVSSPRPADAALFALWCIPSILPWLPVPLLTAIFFWLIMAESSGLNKLSSADKHGRKVTARADEDKQMPDKM